ncbi:PAX-interacting protein 1-like [Bolinopsis microptera]|uniref:PAX-interacting protein 1-like n=1 Tax=Bolinopsis microptera TaxID=2820187 RepID=UPI00307A294E
MALPPAHPQLFAHVKYFVTADVSDEIKALLKEGGAKKEFYVSDLVTHVITESANFSEREDCSDKLTVKSTWVKLSHQMGYLLPTQPFTVFPVGLFSAYTLTTSGIKGDDYYAVWSMVHWNGGVLARTLSQKTTHLIVGAHQSLVKYRAAVANNIPVVVIEWLLDSIERGTVLPTDQYILHIPGYTPPRAAAPPTPTIPSIPTIPSPRVSQSPRLNPLVPPSPLLAPTISSPTLTSPDTKEEEKTTTRKRPPKKNNKKKKDANNNMNMFPMTPAMIGQAGVPYPHTPSPLPPTPSPHTPNTVSPDRFGLQQQSPYMMANSAQYMQFQQAQAQAAQGGMVRLGYPPGGPAGAANRQQWNNIQYQQQMMAQQQKQGYFGPGQYPGQMPPGYPGRNTPTSYPPNTAMFQQQVQQQQAAQAQQAQAAQQQAQQQQQQQAATQQQHNQTLANQALKAAPTPPPEVTEEKETRYQTLKNCTLMLIDYPEYYSKDIINKWRIVIEEHGGEIANYYNPEFVTHVICMSRMSDIYKRALEDGKCVTTAHWLNDVVIGKEYMIPHNPLHIPTQFKTGLPDCSKMKISVTGYEGKERIYVKDMIRVIGAVYTGELSQQNTHLISRKTEGLKYTKAQKWGTKVISARWLSDIVLYGVVSVTTEKKYTALGDPKEMILHESVMPKLIECWHNFNQKDPKPVSKFKSPVILFTGLPSDKNQKLTQMIKRMRCTLTTDVREATHLITCKIVRTVKFLSAMSQCSYILTASWIEQSCNRKMLIDESSFILEDKENEQALGFCVRDSLTKARLNKVFKDCELFLTPHIQPGPRDMKTIIECGGGSVITEDQALGRVQVPAERRKPFYVVSCSSDQMICQQFYQKEVQIYTSEFVLSAALTQQADFDSNKLFVQDYRPEENSGGS